MGVHIDELHTDVTVESSTPGSYRDDPGSDHFRNDSGGEGQGSPGAEERWVRELQRLQWRTARVSAVGFED